MMAKGGVYRIKGDENPLTGVKTFYNVVEWYAETPLAQRKEELVTWELYVKGDNGYRSTGIKKRGVNHFTFGPNAHKFSYKVEGYLHEAEGKEPMAIFVQPQKNEKVKAVEKDILGVSLTYHDGSKITKALNYMDRLKAVAKCQGLEGLKIVFTLWEDDEIKEGHNTKNQFITKSLEIQVDSKGYARWNFTLFNTFISLANKREDDKKQHEYYVTAEYVGKYKSSGNVNVNNPEAGKTTSPSKPSSDKNQPLPTTVPSSKPQPKPNAPKSSTNPSSKNNQTDVKGIVKSVKITDKNGNTFKTNPKFGDTIRITIDAKDVKGLPYNLRVWESDYVGGNDILYNGIHKFKNDLQYVLCTLTDKMRLAGEKGNDSKNPDSGEYQTGYYQEIFAEIVFMHASSKSSNIDVDLTAEQKKQVLGLSTTSVNKKPVDKPKSKCECQQYNLVWGRHANVSCEFRKKVVEISKRQNFDPNHLMAVMKVESAGTFSTSKIELVITGYRKNGNAIKEYKPLSKEEILKKDENFKGAVGLIQFTPAAITELNKAYGYKLTKRKLALMSQLEQLNYVEDYIKFWKKTNNITTKLTLADLYLVVFAPGKMNGSDDNTTLYAKHTEYYNANASVDTDGKNGITKKEIASRAYISLAEGALEREDDFECGSSKETTATAKSNLKWHEPVKNPVCTLYMQSGGGGKKTVGEHWGLFGSTRNGSTHQGLDLFVLPGSEVYACTNGIVHKVTWHSGYGNTVTIKVTDKESFYDHRREYSLLHASNGEIIQGNNFDKTKDIFLFYAHLNKVLVEEGNIVKSGKVIAKSGVSGVKTGTAAPHLHFEIFTTLYAVGKGLNYRCNPGFYVHFKGPNEQSQIELDLQKKTAKSKIDNFYGEK